MGSASARKMIDCRTMPSENNCSLAIAGTEDEVLDAAVHHAITVHGHEDAPELREMIRSGLVNAEPALA
jgi:predicted small metal-binding protein